MIRKKDVFFILAGISISRYFSQKVNIVKDNKIERQNAEIEIFDRWLTLRDKGVSIVKYLEDTKCKKIAIYGLAMIGNHLYEELVKTEIEIIGIDRADIHDNFQMPVYKPDDNCYEGIDLIIITSCTYEKIYQNLRRKYSGKIISFRQLLSECELYLY